MSRRAIALPGFQDVVAAAARIEGHAVRTPLLESGLLNERLGGRLLVKAEVLQRSGSFKFRGAYNSISRLGRTRRSKGVVAFSSGNHAQGVAAAAELLGVAATIVMPDDAPETKLAATRALGAKVVLYDRASGDREAIAAALAGESGAALIKPFDAFDTIAGQGTVGLELAEQAQALGATLDAILVPCSGGGLSAGIVLAVNELVPGAAVHTVEPEGYDDWARSLAAGRRVANEPAAPSLCDALLLKEPGELTFALAAAHLGPGLVVSESEVRHAMATAFRDFRLVVEPGGAVALAAVLAGRFDCRERTVAVIASGGNVDAALYAGVLTKEAARPAR